MMTVKEHNLKSKNESASMVRDLTEGGVFRLLITFAAPLFVSNALQGIYNVVDMIVVGQVIGGTGMSAVSTGGNILHILTFLAMGFSSAGQVIIARDVGQGDMEGVKKTIGSMFTLLLGMSLGMAFICYLLRRQILGLVNTPAEAWNFTMDYTVICICGLVFIYGYNIVSAIMRGMGDSKRPFIFVAIAAVLNMALDIIFVAFMGMEVAGAALATVIGQGFSFIYAMIYLYHHKESFGFDFKLSSFKPETRTVQKLFSLGIPMAIQSAAISISQTIVAAWVNSFGVTASAMAGIISKINLMAGIMTNSITTAAASMVGQNLGAKKYDRVKKTLFCAFCLALVFAIICSAIMTIWPQTVISWFTSDEAVLAEAMIVVGPMLINFMGAAGRSFGFGIINGSGNSKLNLLVAILDGMIARISLAYILGFIMEMGPEGFWYGDAIAGFMPLIIGGVFFLSGKWKK